MSGQWPSEWEDPDDEFPEGDDHPDAAADPRLSEMAAYLASVPAPVLPDAVEARISAAIADEAAARSPRSGRPRTLGSAPARARVRRRRPSRSAMVIGPLLLALIFAGLGYALSRGAQPATSSSAAGSSAAASSAGAGPAMAAPEPAAGTGPDHLSPLLPGQSPVFVVTASGVRYERATLAGQVQARMAVNPASSPSAPATAPSSSSSRAAGGFSLAGRYAPTPALVGCVLHLTGGAAPRLVDLATYEGTPAYVIADSSRVWVVGLGCTATHTDVVTSVSLAGLPGISAA